MWDLRIFVTLGLWFCGSVEHAPAGEVPLAQALTSQIPLLKSSSDEVAAAEQPVVHSSPHLSLAQWLDLSWFYPAGFEKERITETSRAWIVLGNDVVYKFLKAGSEASSPRESFRRRWRASCEELLDNRPFAPDLYLGLRLLRWVDDEPQWISESPGFDLNPRSAPSRADDVAIVMRRIPESARLSHQLESRRGIPRRQIAEIGRTLAAFHSKIRERRRNPFDRDPDSILTALRARYVGSVASFVSEFGTFLDPFSQIAFHEVRGFISSFFSHHSERFLARGNAGFIIDGHGALRSERVVYLRDHGSRKPQFATRIARDSLERSDDVLADLALLSVDLEARGLPHVARELEGAFHAASPEGTADPRLYRFYKAACAMRCAEQLLRGAFQTRETSATDFLATAFRHATGLTTPFLLAIGGADAASLRTLARSVGEFISVATVSVENTLPELPSYSAPDDLILERLLEAASRKILSGSSVIIIWPFNRDEERALLARTAESLRVPHLLVQCMPDPASKHAPEPDEALQRRHVRVSLPWIPPYSAPQLPLLHLQTALPSPELAIRVIDQLRSGIARTEPRERGSRGFPQ